MKQSLEKVMLYYCSRTLCLQYKQQIYALAWSGQSLESFGCCVQLTTRKVTCCAVYTLAITSVSAIGQPSKLPHVREINTSLTPSLRLGRPLAPAHGNEGLMAPQKEKFFRVVLRKRAVHSWACCPISSLEWAGRGRTRQLLPPWSQASSIPGTT